jgi:serine/threonine-protein kinase
MVFEFLAGGSLDDRLVNGDELVSGEVMSVAREVAAGLAHAHERGVVHRDIKPGNIMFDAEGRAKIADFGIARVLGKDTLTDAGTLLGTAAYISPEQVRGEQATPASDVYSFGVILYRLLAGRLPFEAASSLELAALHRDAARDRPDEHGEPGHNDCAIDTGNRDRSTHARPALTTTLPLTASTSLPPVSTVLTTAPAPTQPATAIP